MGWKGEESVRWRVQISEKRLTYVSVMTEKEEEGEEERDR